jgi:hypothetical protein
MSAGIALVDCTGLATVDGCAVRATRVVAQKGYADICVVSSNQSRIRNCRITRPQSGSAAVNRGILVDAVPLATDAKHLTSVDASGNHLDITKNPVLRAPDLTAIEIMNSIRPGKGTNASDIVFVGNVVIQLGSSRQPAPAVALTADTVAATGNRVRSDVLERSLVITYGAGLSCVGNVVAHNVVTQPAAGAANEAPPTNSSNISA